MRTRRNAYVLAAAALLWAGTATAGTVYLPLAINGALDGKTYKSYVWVTNGSGGPQEISIRYIPKDTVGVNPDASQVTAKLSVAPGQTFKVAVGGPGVGMVEFSGSDDVILAGRLESLTPGGVVRSSAHLPLVGSDNVVPAGEVAHLQGGERRLSGSASHFGVATFGAEDGECTVKIFRADGSQVSSTVTLWGPALGQRWFPDTFDILQEPSISDARFEVSCNVPFIPFSAILGNEPDSTQFVLPSVTGAANLGPAPPGPQDGELVRLPGTFFTAVRGASIFDVTLPIDPGVKYNQIVWEFDVVVPAIRDSSGTNFHSTTLLLRPVRGGTHFAHTIRGNGIYKSIIDLGDHQLVRGDSNGWSPNTMHHVKVVYDTAERRMVWELSRNGGVVERLVANIGNRNLTHHGEGLHILFGLDKEYDHGAYLPPYNFRFSDLVVTGKVAE
ncbi:MAG TPA: hypothetical protein VM617_02555 [Thermoanaerobaculia bacterium]|nr:hypothetical protein [Thermoanaerobaculia bacterium]